MEPELSIRDVDSFDLTATLVYEVRGGESTETFRVELDGPRYSFDEHRISTSRCGARLAAVPVRLIGRGDSQLSVSDESGSSDDESSAESSRADDLDVMVDDMWDALSTSDQTMFCNGFLALGRDGMGADMMEFEEPLRDAYFANLADEC